MLNVMCYKEKFQHRKCCVMEEIKFVFVIITRLLEWDRIMQKQNLSELKILVLNSQKQ